MNEIFENEIFEADQQDFSEIRRLCLICHGLDRTSDSLFENSSYGCKSKETKKVFKDTMKGSLKKLAMAIQVDVFHKERIQDEYPTLSGGSIYYENYRRVHKDLNIKDVCDKIVNSDSVSKEFMPAEIFGDSKLATLFTGEHCGEKWALYFSVDSFVEAILNFLDELEADASCRHNPPVNLPAQESPSSHSQKYYGAFL
jgi:hypothetical protein